MGHLVGCSRDFSLLWYVCMYIVCVCISSPVLGPDVAVDTAVKPEANHSVNLAFWLTISPCAVQQQFYFLSNLPPPARSLLSWRWLICPSVCLWFDLWTASPFAEPLHAISRQHVESRSTLSECQTVYQFDYPIICILSSFLPSLPYLSPF